MMVMSMVKTSSPRLTHTFLAWSLSSIWPRSLPLAWAILFPDTRFPTITEAGPISAAHTRTHTHTISTSTARTHHVPAPVHRATDRWIWTCVCSHLVVSAGVWAGWWRRCGGTWARCRGAAPPPGTAAWSLTGECRPGESWAECWPGPEPGRTRPRRGCCRWPERRTDGSPGDQELLWKSGFYCEM